MYLLPDGARCGVAAQAAIVKSLWLYRFSLLGSRVDSLVLFPVYFKE